MVRLLAFFITLFISISSTAQTSLSGRVYYKQTDSVLAGINVFNLNKHIAATSGKDGRYTISAGEDDKIVFSATGFRSDTMTVSFSMLLTEHNAEMEPAYISLKAVTVFSNYRADSLNRRNEYRSVFENTPNIIGGNRPANGFGISVSPLSFFSARAKAQRKLKKKLLQEEKESYIDYSFPDKWVASLTGLRGDSLRLFVYQYRPSYDFCRKTDRQGMIVYINDSLKEFRKPKKK